ncbi:MAG: hypothetical protein CMI54_02420 [Parcubacteria group bacterium]|jgi:hypothetical protein|nr:hypothetical protein [Parcubacteria group bacterium]|tara:strand:+ start:18795 stop:19130 length:336 start_codon:yes stop_codon:yes gene_type:complete
MKELAPKPETSNVLMNLRNYITLCESDEITFQDREIEAARSILFKTIDQLMDSDPFFNRMLISLYERSREVESDETKHDKYILFMIRKFIFDWDKIVEKYDTFLKELQNGE